VRPGFLTIIDLSDIIDIKKKQVIVSHFANKLFSERRKKSIPPFLLVLEESHQFCPERVSEEQAVSRGIIRTIAREGRKFGASICLVSQRPVQLDTTALSQCNTKIILRITNPYDLKHIAESAEAIDQRSLEMITSLQVGEALVIGEAVNYPLFFKVRERKSLPSKHEISLEDAAVEFESSKKKNDEETEAFL
jgi:DNA helicase HerA-like ATPase